jgi:hypothetical protein
MLLIPAACIGGASVSVSLASAREGMLLVHQQAHEKCFDPTAQGKRKDASIGSAISLYIKMKLRGTSSNYLQLHRGI